MKLKTDFLNISMIFAYDFVYKEMNLREGNGLLLFSF